MNNLKSLFMVCTVLSAGVMMGYSSPAVAKTVWLESDDYRTVAEGDGDYQPTQFTLTDEEVSLQTSKMKQAAATPQKETVKDDQLPTLTAEGSYLLPTYVLPDAQKAETNTVTSVDAANPWRNQNTKTSNRVPPRVSSRSIASNNVTSNMPAPVSSAPATVSNPAASAAPQIAQPVAFGTTRPALTATSPATPVAAPATSSDTQLLASIEKQYQETTSLLEATSRRLEALELGIENLSQKTGSASSSAAGELKVVKEEPKAPLLLPLAPIKTIAKSEPEEETIANAGPVKQDYADYILNVIKRNSYRTGAFSESDDLILRSIPKDMKISFLPDSADLSEQAMKWVKIFSYNPQRTVGSAVEIRLSPNNLDLQSRRFALLQGALLANGLAPRQIRFVFTDRDPNTVVLRNIKLPEEQETHYNKTKDGKISQQIIQKW